MSVVESGNKFAKIIRMARPTKKQSDRKSADLRVPLTESQKELIAQVAQLEGIDMATWARPVLLRAAAERIAESRSRGGNGSQEKSGKAPSGHV